MPLITITIQGGEGGGSDIGALLSNLGPLSGSLSGVSLKETLCKINIICVCVYNACKRADDGGGFLHRLSDLSNYNIVYPGAYLGLGRLDSCLGW